AAFDPQGMCNPGKIIPTSRSCGEACGAARRAGKERRAAPPGSAGDAETKRRAGEEQFVAPTHTPAQASRPAASSRRSFDPQAAHAGLARIVGEENIVASQRLHIAASHPNASPAALEVAPASAGEICEILRLAAREAWTVVPAGACTWLEVGNPLRRADVIIKTSRIRRIIEHEPADLIATAEAGVTLDELNAELSHAGQWLPLDPPDDGRATIGGVAATGLAGAHGFGYGAPRAALIGMRVALADGRVVKAGGRVVKNVAGYDLCKLFVGSYGTLGLILELTFKLRPRPMQMTTVIATGPLASMLKSARAVLDAKLFPVALELLSPRLAASSGISTGLSDSALLIRFAGSLQSVAYQAERARDLIGDEKRTSTLDISTDDRGLWRRVAALPLQPEGQLMWRANVLPAGLGAFLEAIAKRLGEAFSSSLWHAGAGDGRVRVVSSVSTETGLCVAELEHLRASARAAGGALIIESAPREVKETLDAWGDVGPSASLMRRVKRQLDPEDMFCPGRFVAGI
ncbi:MAG TPA: FAD-binding protein, partial [Pyrinomonadaceae bacterium]|nr:FAD-binding protein [Pyrinomonadaceae bacterium]